MEHRLVPHLTRHRIRNAVVESLLSETLSAEDLAGKLQLPRALIKVELLKLYLIRCIKPSHVFRHRDVPKHWSSNWYEDWVIYWQLTSHAREHNDHYEMFQCPGCQIRRSGGYGDR